MAKNRTKNKKKRSIKKRKLFPFLFALTPLFVGLLILVVDIFAKYYISDNIPKLNHESQWYPYRGIGVFENFLGIEFSIVHATNRGAAWGVLADYQDYLLLFRILCVAGLIVYLLFFNKNRLMILPLTLVVAGAAGNIIDYFVYGHVVDMLKFVFWGYEYPVFNLADSAIFIGICSVIMISILSYRKTLLYQR